MFTKIKIPILLHPNSRNSEHFSGSNKPIDNSISLSLASCFRWNLRNCR